MKYTQEESDNTIEVFLDGNFLYNSHDTFFEIVGMIKGKVAKTFIFNMEKLKLLDSAALGMLVIAKDEAQAKGIRLIIRKAHGQPHKLLEEGRFDRLYEIEDF